MADQRDLIETLRSTGQRITGAADLILQATQPDATITDTALDADEFRVGDRPLALRRPPPKRPSSRNAGCRRADARPLRGPLTMKTVIHTLAAITTTTSKVRTEETQRGARVVADEAREPAAEHAVVPRLEDHPLAPAAHAGAQSWTRDPRGCKVQCDSPRIPHGKVT